MGWLDDDDAERKREFWKKSKYWSDVCKDLGKYVLTGGVAAPFLGISGAVLSAALLLSALVIGGAVLYIGSKLAPDESLSSKSNE